MDNLFYLDYQGTRISYNELLEFINTARVLKPVIKKSKVKEIFFDLVLSLVYDIPVILLDSDLSDEEIAKLVTRKELEREISLKKNSNPSNFTELRDAVLRNKKWKIALFTSGTTGTPKRIEHPFSTFFRSVRTQNHENDVWGFAYNPTHIAGLQVFFQALLNGNTIINIFELLPETITALINKYEITHISATPTYYKLLSSVKTICRSVKRVTSGGEKFTPELREIISRIFPNAKVHNIYASTEAGTILIGNGRHFTVDKDMADNVKIVNGELYIHKSLIGQAAQIKTANQYFPTGDLVKIISTAPLTIEFIGRKEGFINVGGYRVNPEEVEEIIKAIPEIVDARVYGKKNSLTGNIIAAEILLKENSSASEAEIRSRLKKELQDFKIPRIINFVDKISATRTGKKKRA